MLSVEGVRARAGALRQGQVDDRRAGALGLENLALDQKKLDALGFAGVMRPISTSCADHMGATWARVHTWDGAKWNFSSDWYQADEQIIKPMIKSAADKYAAEKKLTRARPKTASPDATAPAAAERRSSLKGAPPADRAKPAPRAAA